MHVDQIYLAMLAAVPSRFLNSKPAAVQILYCPLTPPTPFCHMAGLLGLESAAEPGLLALAGLLGTASTPAVELSAPALVLMLRLLNCTAVAVAPLWAAAALSELAAAATEPGGEPTELAAAG